MRNLISIGYMGSDTYSFQPHKHDCWEISYYTRGTGTNTIGGEKFEFQAGDIICQPPGIVHSEKSKNGYRNIYFTIKHFDCPSTAVQIFRDNDSKLIYNLLMQIHTEAHMQRKNWKNICESLLNTAYQYMQSFATDNHSNKYTETIKDILISNLSNKHLKIEDVMGTIPFSKDHARRLFIKETGITPREYLIEKRINLAKQLITTYAGSDEINFKKIAHQTGFEDPYYFSRAFKKITGMSPTEWKNMNKKS